MIFIKVFLSLLVIVSYINAQTDSFKIIQPLQKYISHESHSSIIIEPKIENIDTLKAFSNNSEIFKVNINKKRTHYCETIELDLGYNTITVVGYKDGISVDEKKVSIFLTSPMHKDYKYPPEEFTERYFHNNKNEKLCQKCHNMSVNEIEGVAFEKISDSNCYECHNKITNKQHGHAPAVNWLCTSCHNGKNGRYNRKETGKSKYIAPDPLADLCFKCHEKQKILWDTKRFRHEPTDSGRCNKCHKMHSGDEKFYLRKTPRELCVNCHKGKESGEHIVKTFSRVAHPTQNVKDPSRKGEMLSCTSCHNPHVSNTASLLVSDSTMGLCGRCHSK